MRGDKEIERDQWVEIFITKCYGGNMGYSTQIFHNYSTPSTSGKGKSSSWNLVESIKALPRMRVRDNLPNSWLVASLSSVP